MTRQALLDGYRDLARNYESLTDRKVTLNAEEFETRRLELLESFKLLEAASENVED